MVVCVYFECYSEYLNLKFLPILSTSITTCLWLRWFEHSDVQESATRANDCQLAGYLKLDLSVYTNLRQIQYRLAKKKIEYLRVEWVVSMARNRPEYSLLTLWFTSYYCKLQRDPIVEPSAYHVARQEVDHSCTSGSDS